jgi:hypothetical protein
MISLANAFILLLLVGAGILGVSALVEKRSVRRRGGERAHPDAAS